MARLWGETPPVPDARIRSLAGGETLTVVGREVKVEYTPGHASHHVSYLDAASRVAFVGDTAGIRRGSGAFVMPPTPPPDIDLEAWRASEQKLLAWDPDTMFLTHFGPYHGARQHLQAMFETIADWSGTVRRLLADAALNDQERQQRFVDEVFQNLRHRLGDVEAADYTKAGGLNFSYTGLARYWQNRSA
jgi:glyoxylase-like metal-dependent hydrolase (beta-lactamase superfamily II)